MEKIARLPENSGKANWLIVTSQQDLQLIYTGVGEVYPVTVYFSQFGILQGNFEGYSSLLSIYQVFTTHIKQ